MIYSWSSPGKPGKQERRRDQTEHIFVYSYRFPACVRFFSCQFRENFPRLFVYLLMVLGPDWFHSISGGSFSICVARLRSRPPLNLHPTPNSRLGQIQFLSLNLIFPGKLFELKFASLRFTQVSDPLRQTKEQKICFQLEGKKKKKLKKGKERRNAVVSLLVRVIDFFFSPSFST